MNWKTRLQQCIETAPIQGDGHYAWRREDIPDVLRACRDGGAAVVGIEVWAISGNDILAAIPAIGGGTCSFAWGAPAAEANQPWEGFVDRCSEAVLDWVAQNDPAAEIVDAYREHLFYHLSFADASEMGVAGSVDAAPATVTSIHDALKTMFNQAPIKTALGMSIDFDADGRAVFTLPADPNFFHGMGDVHGGLITTLLDNAGWFAAAARVERRVLTADLNVRFLQPARRKDITATGKVVRAGRSSVVCEMEAVAADGRVIATATGAFAVTKGRVKA